MCGDFQLLTINISPLRLSENSQIFEASASPELGYIPFGDERSGTNRPTPTPLLGTCALSPLLLLLA